jgi:acetolactate synthase-1/2/3 large subunit
MIETPKPVILDCRVFKTANVFPMIPSGEAHNNMLLGDADGGGDMEFEVSDAGKMLV